MASIGTDSNGHRRILFVAPDGSRKTVRLGKVDQKTAEAVCRHVEALLSAKIAGQPIPRETAAWLAGIGDVLRDRLAAVKLIEPRAKACLGEFLRGHVLTRPDVKPATLEVWQQPVRNLIDFFGEQRELRSITPGDAENFRAWLMTQRLAPTTVAKRLTFARTFFHVARKHRLIDENPFSEVKIPPADVTARQRFIDRPTIQKVLDIAPPIWRTIIALVRFGGLRCPSEVLSLEWRHVNWEKALITVVSPKTDRYAGKGQRVIPLFEALRPYLLEAFEQAEPGQTYVVGGGYLAVAQGPHGWRNCNLRSRFEDLIRRAGLEPWPRLFHALRSSCETELLADYPVHVVARWMGHDPKISLKHYAQITPDDYRRAAGLSVGVNADGKEAAHFPAQQPAEMRGKEQQSKTEHMTLLPESAAVCGVFPHCAPMPERRGGDSNPRDPCGPTGFRNRPVQPLRHLSVNAPTSAGAGTAHTNCAVVGRQIGVGPAQRPHAAASASRAR